MSHQSDRGRFVEIMRQEGVPERVSMLVMRDASMIQRLAVEDCNVGLTERQRKQDAACETRITRRLQPYNVTPIFGGDPRGACVKVKVPSGRTDDWGQSGLCVPTPRY